MQIWIVNPFEELPVDGQRPLRYGTLSQVLAGRGHRVVWWSSDFSHLRKTHRPPPPDGEGIAFHLLETPAYHRHVGVARWWNHAVYARRFHTAASRAIQKGEMEKPDLILLSIPPLGVSKRAFAFRREWNCKVVVDIVDAWPQTFLRLIPGGELWRRSLGNLLFRPFFHEVSQAYRGADGVTAVARAFLGLPRQARSTAPTHLTYLGGDMLGEEAFDQRHSSVRTDPLRFVYIGAMARSYDLETVLRAAARLKEQEAGFQIHLAGAGPKEPGLREMADRLGLGSHMVFHGYLDSGKLHRLLAGCHVALNPVFDDSWIAFPYKMSEYLCAGLPVLNCLSGETREMLETHGAGLWYPAGDDGALGQLMLRYCRDREEVVRAGDRAWNLAQREFDRAKTYPAWAEFLEGIARPGRKVSA